MKKYLILCGLSVFFTKISEKAKVACSTGTILVRSKSFKLWNGTTLKL